MPEFRIVGAGLAGALMAVYLGRRGEHVTLYERRGDMRREPVPRGRSINMALSTRGLHALREVGLERDILQRALPMRGRMIHSINGQLTLQAYGVRQDECIYSISRDGLNIALLDAAERFPNVQLRFRQRAVGIDLDKGRVLLDGQVRGRNGASSLLLGNQIPEDDQIEDGIVIGADGAHSVVRAQLQRLDRYQYHQNYLEWGYKELSLPAGPDGTWILSKHALHIWPRGNFMLIALPNLDGSFTCTLFLPFEGPNSFDALGDENAVLSFFRREFPDVITLMPDLTEDFRLNPTSSLAYVKCFPWHYQERVVLVGDACHAVVPFYGQGMNAAFEGCSVLAACMLESSGDWNRAFCNYERLRKENTDALADLALSNFEEMRDKINSPYFHARNRLEKMLHVLLPDSFLPLYSMVSFSRIPYAEAIRRARSQNKLLCCAIGLVAGALGLATLWAIFGNRRQGTAFRI